MEDGRPGARSNGLIGEREIVAGYVWTKNAVVKLEWARSSGGFVPQLLVRGQVGEPCQPSRNWGIVKVESETSNDDDRGKCCASRYFPASCLVLGAAVRSWMDGEGVHDVLPGG
jgi:hypothetical protein